MAEQNDSDKDPAPKTGTSFLDDAPEETVPEEPASGPQSDGWDASKEPRIFLSDHQRVVAFLRRRIEGLVDDLRTARAMAPPLNDAWAVGLALMEADDAGDFNLPALDTDLGTLLIECIMRVMARQNRSSFEEGRKRGLQDGAQLHLTAWASRDGGGNWTVLEAGKRPEVQPDLGASPETLAWREVESEVRQLWQRHRPDADVPVDTDILNIVVKTLRSSLPETGEPAVVLQTKLDRMQEQLSCQRAELEQLRGQAAVDRARLAHETRTKLMTGFVARINGGAVPSQEQTDERAGWEFADNMIPEAITISLIKGGTAEEQKAEARFQLYLLGFRAAANRRPLRASASEEEIEGWEAARQMSDEGLIWLMGTGPSSAGMTASFYTDPGAAPRGGHLYASPPCTGHRPPTPERRDRIGIDPILDVGQIVAEHGGSVAFLQTDGDELTRFRHGEETAAPVEDPIPAEPEFDWPPTPEKALQAWFDWMKDETVDFQLNDRRVAEHVPEPPFQLSENALAFLAAGRETAAQSILDWLEEEVLSRVEVKPHPSDPEARPRAELPEVSLLEVQQMLERNGIYPAPSSGFEFEWQQGHPTELPPGRLVYLELADPKLNPAPYKGGIYAGIVGSTGRYVQFVYRQEERSMYQVTLTPTDRQACPILRYALVPEPPKQAAPRANFNRVGGD